MTLDDALAHPTWSMGPKITVDSATLANKGLELIEAHFLFGLPYDLIEVVVHPTSIVHALVRLATAPRWRTSAIPTCACRSRTHSPIRSARDAAAAARLRAGLTLEFERSRPRGFPLLALAREAGRGAAPIRAPSTPRTRLRCRRSSRADPVPRHRRAVEDVLARVDGAAARDLDELVEADRSARNLVAVA